MVGIAHPRIRHTVLSTRQNLEELQHQHHYTNQNYPQYGRKNRPHKIPREASE
ncbi:MAG: hypothetical protein HC908_08035 [Calothrix sp. SM1_7_51]|nr:hypothetical protein [Calothrix sp. SM1_7_51]